MLKEIAAKWFDYLEQRYAKKTKQSYRFVLTEFLSTLPLNIHTSEITPIHIQDYVKYLLENDHSNRTCNHYYTILQSFFHWAKDYYQVQNPTEQFSKLIEKPPKSRCLSEKEYQQIKEITSGFENAAIQFLGNTGLRSNEYRNLKWVDFINEPDKGFCFVHILGKGNKERYVPLNNTCKKIISQYPQNGEIRPDFIEHFQYQEKLYLLGQKLARNLSIPPFGPHALRHYFATRLIRAGVPLIKVSKLLGHSSIKTTEQIYIHLVPLDFSGVTDCLDQ
ncbi:MAG: tyrosine-type recombinase/integrase [Promethearchaeota archaeon]